MSNTERSLIPYPKADIGGRFATSAASADASATSADASATSADASAASADASAANADASAANAGASAANNINPFMFVSATSDEQVANESTSESRQTVNNAQGSEKSAVKHWHSACQAVLHNKLGRPEPSRTLPVPNGLQDGRSSAIGVSTDMEVPDGTMPAAHERVVDISVKEKSGQ